MDKEVSSGDFLIISVGSCSGYQDWQFASQLGSLKRHWPKVKALRLMSCEDSARKHHKANESMATVVAKDYGQAFSDDNYKAYNRPFALRELTALENWEKKIRRFKYVVLVDPDMVFYKPLQEFAVPRNDREIVGGKYFYMSPKKMNDVARQVGREDLVDKIQGWIGAPYVVPSQHLKKLSESWCKWTREVRKKYRNKKGKKDWCSEMYSFVLAADELGLRLRVEDELMHIPDGQVSRQRPTASNPTICHFCQGFGPSKDKKDHWKKRNFTSAMNMDEHALEKHKLSDESSWSADQGNPGTELAKACIREINLSAKKYRLLLSSNRITPPDPEYLNPPSKNATDLAVAIIFLAALVTAILLHASQR